MHVIVDHEQAYAYTGGQAFDAARPTLVFVHGAANDHSVWALQSRWFAFHGYNVFAVDLPAHGRSTGSALPTVDAIARWLWALLDAAGVARATLIGHSLGALAVLAGAGMRAERTARVAVLGPAVPMVVSDELLAAARDDEPLAYAMINAWSLSAAGKMGASPAPGMSLAGTGLALMARTSRGVLATDLAACHAYADGLAAAAHYRGPALVIMGARDQMAPPRSAAALVETLADVCTVTLADTGHALMSEQPDAVLDALRTFISAAD